MSNPNLAWTLLLIAGLLEIVWSVSMKASQGFSKSGYTALTFVAAWISFWLLGLAVKSLPIGTAYAAWTGVGAAGAAIVGILVFHEPSSLARLGCIALILAGVIGLHLLGE